MLIVHHISFAYNNTKVINSIDFKLTKGNTLCLLGKSGCGKSTLIKLLYGLHDLDEGSISWNEQLILGPKYNLIPGPSFMKYLAQDFNLMPYSTVEENVGIALSNSDPEKKKKRIRDLLDTVEMIDFLHVKAKYLSGGQQQRVALAKALANEPEILLLDEPFSQIDLFKKNTLSRNLFTYLKKKKITCIFATHDSMDALSFADTVMIMKNGKILTQNHPTTLYKTPKNHYIASLFEEVNTIAIQHFIPWYEEPEKKILIYASELYPIEKSNFKVRVKKNYFKGSHYLIETQLKHQSIFFTHSSPITEKETVYLTTSENTLLNRL